MLVVLTIVCVFALTSYAQVPIPNKPLGFVYKNGSHDAPVHIDIYIDLACPDSKMAFPVIQQVADFYMDKSVRVKFLMFPLPYHRNAHMAAIGAQAASANPMSNSSPDDAAIAWAKVMFDNQAKWTNSATRSNNQDEILSIIASYSTSLGYNATSFKKMLSNSEYDWSARVEWKYGCSRGVAGTPWYFINGVNIAADASWNLAKWKQVINAILNGRTLMANF